MNTATPSDSDDPRAGDADDELRLTADQFKRLAEYGSVEDVADGDVLYSTGDSSYDLFLLDSAVVEVVRDATATSPESTIYERGPGEFLGELNLLTGQTVYLTSRVTQAGRVTRIRAAQFRKMMGEQVDIADLLIAAMRARRRIMQESATSALEIVGPGDSAETRALRTFAARLDLPHSALDCDSVAGQTLMAAHGLDAGELPAAVIAERVLVRATPRDLAEVLGFTYEPGQHDIDLVIVGAGPAGLAAAVYGASEGLVTVIVDAAAPGGQAATSSRIENYLGFPRGVSGQELTRRALVQALKFGAQVYAPCEVTGLEVGEHDGPTVILSDHTQVRARAAILATGARYRRLDVPRWSEFEARGQIRYSATELDARGCESQPVTVVGGANSAGQAALFLASRGSHVDVLVRGPGIESSMSTYLAQRLASHPMVRVWSRTEICGLSGEQALSGITIRTEHGAEEELETRALFCFIGAEPAIGWLPELARDEDDFILTGGSLPPNANRTPLPYETSIPRVFAAGDIRSGSMKRVASAVGDGASAVASVHAMLAEDERPGSQPADRSDSRRRP